jgi:hypothetical protein
MLEKNIEVKTLRVCRTKPKSYMGEGTVVKEVGAWFFALREPGSIF